MLKEFQVRYVEVNRLPCTTPHTIEGTHISLCGASSDLFQAATHYRSPYDLLKRIVGPVSRLPATVDAW
jgi:hypothetical protein